jgi:hypothetical protein
MTATRLSRIAARCNRSLPGSRSSSRPCSLTIVPQQQPWPPVIRGKSRKTALLCSNQGHAPDDSSPMAHVKKSILCDWPHQSTVPAAFPLIHPLIHPLHLSHARMRLPNVCFTPSFGHSRADSANRLALGGDRDQNGPGSTAAGGLGQVQHAPAVMQGISVPQSNQRRMLARPTAVDDEEDFLAKSKRLCITGKIKANRGLRTVVNYRCDET